MKRQILAKLAVGFVCFCGFYGCNPTSSPNPHPHPGEIIATPDEPVYDKVSGSFTLMVHADSVDDATMTYMLFDGDSLIMQNETGEFTGIPSLEEGYNVQARAEWSDTTMTSPLIHVNGFIYHEPVEKMNKDELQRRINAKDDSLKLNKDPHIVQGVKIKMTNATLEASTLLEVIQNIENGFWPSVKVKTVTYNDDNRITAIVLQPTQENPPSLPDDEDFGY